MAKSGRVTKSQLQTNVETEVQRPEGCEEGVAETQKPIACRGVGLNEDDRDLHLLRDLEQLREMRVVRSDGLLAVVFGEATEEPDSLIQQRLLAVLLGAVLCGIVQGTDRADVVLDWEAVSERRGLAIGREHTRLEPSAVLNEFRSGPDRPALAEGGPGNVLLMLDIRILSSLAQDAGELGQIHILCVRGGALAVIVEQVWLVADLPGNDAVAKNRLRYLHDLEPCGLVDCRIEGCTEVPFDIQEVGDDLHSVEDVLGEEQARSAGHRSQLVHDALSGVHSAGDLVNQGSTLLRITAGAKNGRTSALLQRAHEVQELWPDPGGVATNNFLHKGHLDTKAEERPQNFRPGSDGAVVVEGNGKIQ